MVNEDERRFSASYHTNSNTYTQDTYYTQRHIHIRSRLLTHVLQFKLRNSAARVGRKVLLLNVFSVGFANAGSFVRLCVLERMHQHNYF